MKRWRDRIGVRVFAGMLLVMMLPACGKQPGEALGGETKKQEVPEQSESPDLSGHEDNGELSGQRESPDPSGHGDNGKASGSEKVQEAESAEKTANAGSAESPMSSEAPGEAQRGKSSPANKEETQMQEENDSMAETEISDISFHFDTKTVMLNSGYEMPIYGLGTYSLTGETCVDSVTAALDSGVRLIDTAYMYHNDVICCEV